MNDTKIKQLVKEAWQAFKQAPECVRVPQSAPILFFGDLNAYRRSDRRIVTVGLNPSLEEFPAGSPFKRFPDLAGCEDHRDSEAYLKALSGYFHPDRCPYRRWFNAYESVLKGAESTYYCGKRSTAVHTDICSPVATNPTWSDLEKTKSGETEVLKASGVPLWHTLLKELRPDMVFLSIAKRHLDRIQFDDRGEWQTIKKFHRMKCGKPRKKPYDVCARWFDVNGANSLFVFGQAAQTPFGTLDANRKRKLGATALKEYKCGP